MTPEYPLISGTQHLENQSIIRGGRYKNINTGMNMYYTGTSERTWRGGYSVNSFKSPRTIMLSNYT